MPNQLVSSLTLPVNVDGSIVNTTFDIKDATARQMIENLGSALYWVGITTTALTDGGTDNPITVNGESVTARTGAVAQYDAEEYVFNGTAWQAFGRADFGSLAFKNSATGDFTPSGTVASTVSGGTTTTVNSITDVGALPTFSYASEVLTFNAGTLPTKGTDTSVVTSVGTISSTFTGTQGSVTVE